MATTGPPTNIVKMEDSDRTPYSRFNTAVQIINDYLGGSGAPALASWTPTWTNLTLGNGVVVAKWVQIGKLVFCRLSLVFGTTTSVSGSITFSLPVTAATLGGTIGGPLGICRMFDTSGALVVHGTIVRASTTTAIAAPDLASGTYVSSTVTSSTVPFTWATGDEIITSFWYESA